MASPRPILSPVSRIFLAAGGGFSATWMIASRADRASGPAGADGTSPGRLDTDEARQTYSGLTSAPGVLCVGAALVAASQIYSRGRSNLTPTEFGVLQRAVYPAAGGGLIGTTIANRSLFKDR